MFDTTILLSVVFLIFFTMGVQILWRKRKGGILAVQQAWHARSKKRMTVVERMALTPQHAVHIIRFESSLMMVATTPTNLILLSQFHTAPPQAGGASSHHKEACA